MIYGPDAASVASMNPACSTPISAPPWLISAHSILTPECSQCVTELECFAGKRVQQKAGTGSPGGFWQLTKKLGIHRQCTLQHLKVRTCMAAAFRCCVAAEKVQGCSLAVRPQAGKLHR